MGDTSRMSNAIPSKARISSGPRWNALVDALALAERCLDAPLTSEEVSRGWDEGLRMAILQSVKEIQVDIAETPWVRPGHYKSWVRSEMIDPRVEDARWDCALGPDGAVRDIEQAEDLLNAALSLIEDLPSLLSASPMNDVVAAMLDVLRDIAGGLAGGDYLSLRQFQAWDSILAGQGVSRRMMTGISYIDAERDHLGVNIDYIERRPTGEAWDRIDIYDHLLVDHGGWDISDGGPLN